MFAGEDLGSGDGFSQPFFQLRPDYLERAISGHFIIIVNVIIVAVVTAVMIVLLLLLSFLQLLLLRLVLL